MVLGKSSSLGYLECAVWGERSTKARKNLGITEQEDFGALGGTIKLDGSFGGTLTYDGTETIKGLTTRSKGYAKEEPPIQPLEWTHAPVREVQTEGNMRCRVSKPAVPSVRDSKKSIHLVQTMRLEPQPSSRPSSRASSRPSSRSAPQVKAKEEIVVTEADFRRCGKRLTLLRGCQLTKLPSSPPLKTEPSLKPNEMELSFKSAFKLRCTAADQPILDPWKGIGNPEENRESTEGDMILNQVWLDGKQVQEDEDDIPSLPSDRSQSSTRASSTDPADPVTTSWPLGQGRTSRVRLAPMQRTQDPREYRSRRRARSMVSLTPDAPSGTSSPSAGRLQGHSRRHTSDSVLQAKSGQFKNRIQLIGGDDNEEVPESEWIGCSATRQAARSQKRFEKQLEEAHTKPFALWLSLDAHSGEVTFFPRAAAERLEADFVNHRSTVPLAGLGKDLENDIVYLPSKESGEQPVLKSLHRGQMDVRRIQVQPSCCQVSLHLIHNNQWRIADVPVPGETEERIVLLHRAALVRPPSPPLPPIDPDRRTNFINAGADLWGC